MLSLDIVGDKKLQYFYFIKQRNGEFKTHFLLAWSMGSSSLGKKQSCTKKYRVLFSISSCVVKTKVVLSDTYELLFDEE